MHFLPFHTEFLVIITMFMVLSLTEKKNKNQNLLVFLSLLAESLDINSQLICFVAVKQNLGKKPKNSGINELMNLLHPAIHIFFCGECIQVSDLKLKRLGIVLK